MDRLETTLNELSVQHEELHQLPKFNQARNNLKTYMDLDVAVAAVKDALVGHDTCAQAFERLYAQFKASSVLERATSPPRKNEKSKSPKRKRNEDKPVVMVERSERRRSPPRRFQIEQADEDEEQEEEIEAPKKKQKKEPEPSPPEPAPKRPRRSSSRSRKSTEKVEAAKNPPSSPSRSSSRMKKRNATPTLDPTMPTLDERAQVAEALFRTPKQLVPILRFLHQTCPHALEHNEINLDVLNKKVLQQVQELLLVE